MTPLTNTEFLNTTQTFKQYSQDNMNAKVVILFAVSGFVATVSSAMIERNPTDNWGDPPTVTW